ncbi:hypothetical protein EV197_1071 [Aquimarina brevivitae]|uniref:Uncharacterized protein n=1 Tax=Aquimarina brevivitae TaxID=323412 RepID=A0A4Q7PH19_9FLAO|nr:hypothetical protein EV197_1071 [Aquimarina brevivitae]
MQLLIRSTTANNLKNILPSFQIGKMVIYSLNVKNLYFYKRRIESLIFYYFAELKCYNDYIQNL